MSAPAEGQPDGRSADQPAGPSEGELDAELRARLAALVEEARAAGALEALRSELDRQLAAQYRPPADDGVSSEDDGPIPKTYGMVGVSPPMRSVFDLIKRVAPADVPVLVHGETGTGKELCARALHDHSKRAKKPFLAENCAAVSPTLLESELFGHVKGSFTGAIASRDGHFVAADGGTVFLDEIGDMPLEMQAKLLRVIQEGEVRPVGGNKTQKIDVRVVGATNKDLAAMCREGSFREDLFFRLNVVGIELPPLRDRGEDIVLLVRSILKRVAGELGKPVTVTARALAALGAWRWPGNIRELENELRRSAVLSGGTIDLADLTPAIAASKA